MEKTLECTTTGCAGISQLEFSGKCQRCYHGNRGCPLETKTLDGDSIKDSRLDEGRGSENGERPMEVIPAGCSNHGTRQSHVESASISLMSRDVNDLTYQSSKLKTSSNPDLPALSDVFDNLAACFPYHLSRASSEQGTSRTTTEQNAIQNGRPTAPASEDQVDGCQKKKVSLKPVFLDPCSLEYDVIICLWKKSDIDKRDAYTHPLLARTENNIANINLFRSALLRDEVIETAAGTAKARSVIHCKYDLVADRQIADALLRCVSYTESRKKTRIVLPVVYCEDLQQDPKMATRACMYVIFWLQTNSRNTQSLEKFVMCIDSLDTIKVCKEEFIRITAREGKRDMSSRSRPNCCKCKRNRTARLKPLSSSCDNTCLYFCVDCLKNGREEKLDCPKHGPCVSPVGHKNTYAVLVAGFDSNMNKSKIFREETHRMERLLKCSLYMGICESNIQVITVKRPGTEDNLKQRVTKAFLNLREKLSHSDSGSNYCFYFYYSGHNDETGLVLGKTDRMAAKELRKEFHKLRMNNILIILDCCYSGGAGLTEEMDSEDYTVSLTSYMDGVNSMMYLPRLWNLEETSHRGVKNVVRDRCNKTKVYQWSSCSADERSYIREKKSVFTYSIVEAVKGTLCQLQVANCEACKEFQGKALKADGIFLGAIHDCVEYHVLSRLKDDHQRPQLQCSHKDEFLFAFHGFSS